MGHLWFLHNHGKERHSINGRKSLIAAEKSGKKIGLGKGGKFILETKEEEMERGESRFEQMGSYIMKDKEETIK